MDKQPSCWTAAPIRIFRAQGTERPQGYIVKDLDSGIGYGLSEFRQYVMRHYRAFLFSHIDKEDVALMTDYEVAEAFILGTVQYKMIPARGLEAMGIKKFSSKDEMDTYIDNNKDHENIIFKIFSVSVEKKEVEDLILWKH